MRSIVGLCLLALSCASCITVRDVERSQTGRSIVRSERGLARSVAPPDLDVRFEGEKDDTLALSVRGTQRCEVARRDVIRVDGTVERELTNHVPHLWIAGGFVAAGAGVALGGSFIELQIARQIAWATGGALVGAGVADAMYVGTMALFAFDGEWSEEELETHSNEESCDPVARGLRVSLQLSPTSTTTGMVNGDGSVQISLPTPQALVPEPPDAVPLTPELITAYAVPDDGVAGQFLVPAPLRTSPAVVRLYQRAQAEQRRRVDELFDAWHREHEAAYALLQKDGGALLSRYDELRGDGELAAGPADATLRAQLAKRAEGYGTLLDELARLLVVQLNLPRPKLKRLPGVDPRLASVEAATTFTERVREEHAQLTAFLALHGALDGSFEACSAPKSADAAQDVRSTGGALLWPGPDATNTKAFHDAVTTAGGCRTLEALEALVQAAQTLRPRLRKEREICAAGDDAEARAEACTRASLLARAEASPAAALVDVELSFLVEVYRGPQTSAGARALIEEVMTSGAYRRADGKAVKRYLDAISAGPADEAAGAD